MERSRRPAIHPIAFVPVLVLATVAARGQAIGAGGKFVPPTGRTMVLVGCSWDDGYKTYTRLTGDTPAGGTFFYTFNGDTKFFWHNARENVGEHGVLQIGFNLVADTDGSLAPYLTGQRDDEIKAIGHAFKEWGRPLYVAIGTEFDHKTHYNRSYTPQDYVRTYRRIRDIWDGLGVENVAYVWHSVCDRDIGPFTWAHYPGDKYVDWFGFSFYFYDESPDGTRPAYIYAQQARLHRKPLMVCESGPKNGKARTFEDWHGPLLRTCADLGVRIICYNNWRDPPVGEVFKNSAFDRLPRPIAEAWGRAMKSPTFLHASPELHEILGGGPGGTALASPEPEASGTVGGKSVNLLKRLDPRRDTIQGDWRLAGNVLTFAGDREWSRLLIPYEPPEEYDLAVVAERVQGTELLIIGLVVGGRQATAVLDAWGGGVSGLEKIDGKVSQDNPTTHRGWRFVNGRRTTIVCRVRKDSVTVTCDGKVIIDCRGDPNRLSIVDGWKVPDERRLFLGGWKGGVFRFHKLEVREISGAGRIDAEPPSGVASSLSGGKFCPPEEKRLLIIGQDRDSMTAYVRDTGQVPGGFMSYNHLNAFGGRMGIEPRYIDGLHDFGIAKEYPNTVLQVGLVFKGMEKDIIKGVYDDRLDRLAEWFRGADVPVYLRVGPEFDLPADNGFGWPTYEPEGYKLAFRYIADRFRQRGVENVAFVWHSAAWKGVERAWAFYPGDDYVDWFAVSLFGRENNEGAALFAGYARQRGKPLMIAEATPLGGLVGTPGGIHTWDSWFRPFFDYIERNDVRVVCFIPVDWESIETYRGKGWRDTRVQVVPAIKERWLAEVGKATYLKASEGLFEGLGYRRQTDSGRERPARPGSGEVARTQDGPPDGAGKAEGRIRHVALTLDDQGVGELVVDTGTDEPAAADEPGGETTLAGVPNARVAALGGNSYRIVHDFARHEVASDFSLLAGVLPLSQEGLAIDREAGTLIMTPARRGAAPGMTAKLIYPRYLRLPITLGLDVARFERGAFVLSFKPMAPDGRLSGTFAVNVSPGPDASKMSVSWRPNDGDKVGDWTSLLEQGIEPGQLTRRSFRLPPGAVSEKHRFSPEIAVVGEESVRLSRLEVKGVVVPMIGINFGQPGGEARVVSVLKGGPAEKAGLMVGDVVTAIDGEAVRLSQDAISRVGQVEISQELKLSVRRGGRAMEIMITGE